MGDRSRPFALARRFATAAASAEAKAAPDAGAGPTAGAAGASAGARGAAATPPPPRRPAPALLRACHPRPLVCEFDVSRPEALGRFEADQWQRCFSLHAGDVLKAGGARVTAAYLPFWMFDAEVSVQAKATLGYRVPGSKDELSWTPMAEWRQMAERQRVPHTDPCMQVYASYEWRRDLAKAARPTAEALGAARPLAESEALSGALAGGRAGGGDDSSGGGESGRGGGVGGGKGAAGYATTTTTSSSSTSGGSNTSSSGSSTPPGTVPFQQPELQLAVAWALAHRALRRSRIAAAVEELKAALNADDVRNLQVEMTVHTRRARLAFAPAYHLAYSYGSRYTPSRADIVPESHEALLSGRWGGGVAATAHVSPGKGAAAAAGAVGAVSAAAMQAADWVGALEPALSAGSVAVDAGFLAFLAAAAARVAVQVAPQSARNRHVADQVRAEREFYRQYDRRESAPHEPPDDHTQWLWFDADWRKWEEEDPWHWDPAARRRWAADLLRQQTQRAAERRRYLERRERERLAFPGMMKLTGTFFLGRAALLPLALAPINRPINQREQQAADAEREGARRARYGAPHNPWESAGPGGGGGGPAGPGRPRRRADFLGYYRLMGIDPADPAVDAAAIKAAFKRAALELHPDRHAGGGDAAAVARAAGRFQRLQVAYETLKDPDRRRLYDRGQLSGGG